MSWKDRFDLTNGKLPAWVENLVTVTRPLAVNALIAIPTLGAMSVGLVAGVFGETTALGMARASTTFLAGIPDALYGLIGGAFLTYGVAKTTEAIKAPKPVGGKDPEQGEAVIDNEVDLGP